MADFALWYVWIVLGITLGRMTLPLLLRPQSVYRRCGKRVPEIVYDAVHGDDTAAPCSRYDELRRAVLAYLAAGTRNDWDRT